MMFGGYASRRERPLPGHAAGASSQEPVADPLGAAGYLRTRALQEKALARRADPSLARQHLLVARLYEKAMRDLLR